LLAERGEEKKQGNEKPSPGLTRKAGHLLNQGDEEKRKENPPIANHIFSGLLFPPLALMMNLWFRIPQSFPFFFSSPYS
jgi:hypothetical protein